MNSGGATNALSHFECDPFDLLGNAPYVNLQKSFPEKGEKSRREQQILSCKKCADFNDNTMENQEEFPKCRLDFESLKLLDEAGSSRLSLAAEGILVTSQKARHTAICRQKSAAFCEMTLEKAFFTQAVSGCISGVVVLDVR